MGELLDTIVSADTHPRLLGGVIPSDFTIEALIDEKKIRELLYRSMSWTDEQFNELCDDVGSRAARLVLRAKACSGDVKACELYLKLAQQAKADRKKPRAAEERNVTAASGMVQPARPAQD